MTDPATGTVFVVEDDPGMQDAIGVLARSVHLSVEVFDSAPAFLESFQYTGPACLVTDVCLPGMDGVELQQELAKRDPELPLVVISGYGDIPMAVEMMRSGALDFLQKPFRNHDLLARIREALERDAARWRQNQGDSEAAQRLAQLTPREADVAYRLVRGATNKQVARMLQLSPRTVEAHRANILSKLQVQSIAELAFLVLSDGNGNIPDILYPPRNLGHKS